MHTLQSQIISELGVRANIDPDQELHRRITFLRDYLAVTGLGGYVLGISGGQDSTLAGWLAQQAVHAHRSTGARATFTAVRLPYGSQFDADDADKAMGFIAPDQQVRLDIQVATDGFVAAMADSGRELSDFNKGNIKARQRMIAQYAIAAENSSVVIGTDHAAEAVTGFYTKFGDGAADIEPLAGLTKRQGRALLADVGCPEELYLKRPTADLLDGHPGQSDEESLGISYEHIDDYLEGRTIPESAAANLEGKYLRSRHKRRPAVTPSDTWWRDESAL